MFILTLFKLTAMGENDTIREYENFNPKRGIMMSDQDHNHNHDHHHHHHDHDHDHDHDHEEFVLTLTDEDGNDVEMVLVETFDIGEQVYALLLDRNNPEADGVILRMEEENEEMVLYNIEDEEEWARVEEAYNELVARHNQG